MRLVSEGQAAFNRIKPLIEDLVPPASEEKSVWERAAEEMPTPGARITCACGCDEIFTYAEGYHITYDDATYSFASALCAIKWLATA